MFLQVSGENVHLEKNHLVSKHEYNYSEVVSEEPLICQPKKKTYTFKTNLKTPKTGVLLVGWGGNNGSTVTGGILANKHQLKWRNKRGEQSPNYYGSITQCSTFKVGNFGKKEIFQPMNKVLPMVDPNDLIIGGWDISEANLYESMKRAQVMDWDLIQQLEPYCKKLVPWPAVYYEDFIAGNQKSRANHILQGNNKLEHL